MSDKSKKGYIILGIIVACSLICAVTSKVSSINNSKDNESDSENVIVQNTNSKNKKITASTKDYIASIYIEGVITEATKTYNQKWLMDKIDSLKNDKKNKGIILYLNTPGGGVYQSDEVYLALLDYKNSTNRPVYAYMGPLAASGGYYIACGADKIYANRNTLTGSIGVIAGSSMDATELLSKIGIKSYTITAGKNKNMLNYNQPLTEEQKQIMQSVADDAYDQFTQIVSDARKMDINKVKTLADGRIYTARQALSNGLIDGINTWDTTVKETKEAAGDSNFELRQYKYEEEFDIRTFMRSFSTLVTNPAAYINQLGQTNLQINSFKPSYLYTN